MNAPLENEYEIIFTKKDGRTHSFFRRAMFKHDAVLAAMNAFQWRFGYHPVSATSVQEVG